MGMTPVVSSSPSERLSAGDIDLEVVRRGAGRPVLLLHGMQTVDPRARFLDLLGRRAEIIAPSHPGFGHSPRPPDFETVADLVHLYLDVLDTLPYAKVTLMGLSFGGWLAAEIAVKCCHRLDRLVLVDAFGLKLSGRETPDILDVFNTSPQEVRRRSWHDPAKAPDVDAMSDDELIVRARNWDALCLYGWHPYMYNPQLKRWLRRITIPTLVLWGADDGVVKPSYGRGYSALIPGSLFGANPLILGILARQMRNVRILSMGTLVSLRKDPVRIAEEYATADVICRGRLEIGFVKSGGTEMASNNANPVNNVERYWEAIDLIRKALTHQDGPFSWEGKHFTHRHVNIWPRPWQQPHPRLWAATGDPDTATEVGRRGMVNVLVLRGADGTKRAWGAYRQARAEARLPEVGTDHFAYAAFVYVGDTHEEGVRVGSKLLWFLNTSLKSAPQYSKFLPGTVPPQSAPLLYRSAPRPTTAAGGPRPVASASQNAATLIGLTADQARERGILFAGNPDTVYRQIHDFYTEVGGFGHLVMIGRSGFLTHAEAEKGIRLFSAEVMPRLKELG